MKCISKSQLIEDDAIYEINPLSFRYAIICFWCLMFAYEELSNKDKDKYNQLIQK